MAEWQAMEAAMRVRRAVRSSFCLASSESRAGLLDDLGQHPFQSRAFQAHRRGFDRKCLWAKGFHLKAVALQFFGDAAQKPPSAMA